MTTDRRNSYRQDNFVARTDEKLRSPLIALSVLRHAKLDRYVRNESAVPPGQGKAKLRVEDLDDIANRVNSLRESRACYRGDLDELAWAGLD